MTTNKIVALGDPLFKKRPLKVGSTIMPGMLIEYDGNDVKPHATASGDASPIFAVEQPLREGSGVSDAYNVDGEEVMFGVFRRGDELWAWLKAGQNVLKNDLLESAGAGALQAYTALAATPLRPVVRACSSVDNSLGLVAVAIKVEVL